jgi:hypothetical protein
VASWAIQIPVRSLLSLSPLGQIRCGVDNCSAQPSVASEELAVLSASSVLLLAGAAINRHLPVLCSTAPDGLVV